MDRHRQGEHEVALVGEQVLMKPADHQVQGHEGHGDEADEEGEDGQTAHQIQKLTGAVP